MTERGRSGVGAGGLADAGPVRRPEDLLLRQDGVLTRGQARAHGMSDRTVSRRVADGTWRALHPGVYLVGGHRFTDAARIRAAWLWGGDGAVVHGVAAAYWHGMLDRAPGPVGLTLPRTRTRRPRPGVVVRRRDLDPADRMRGRGVAVTAPALTALETAAAVRDGATFLDRALQQGRVGVGDLHEAYCRAAGSHGSARSGELLRACADRADSAAERRLTTLLRRAGLTGFVVAHPFGHTWIDVAFPHARVAIEVDGWAWHTDPARFAADREKGNALVEAGWTLLRFTWRDLTDRPDRVVARVRSAVLRATGSTPG